MKMRAWKDGFDQAEASDYLGDITPQVQEELQPPTAAEGVDEVVDAVNMTAALVMLQQAPAPQRQAIVTLRERTLAVFDSGAESLDPDPAVRRKHRTAIAESFAHLLELCVECPL